MICSIAFTLLGIISIGVSFIWGGKQINLIIGIALLLAGMALIPAKCIDDIGRNILKKLSRY